MTEKSAREYREDFHNADLKQRIYSYVLLLGHPDLVWQDVLDGIDAGKSYSFFAERAELTFQNVVGNHSPATKETILKYLASKDLQMSDRVRADAIQTQSPSSP